MCSDDDEEEEEEASAHAQAEAQPVEGEAEPVKDDDAMSEDQDGDAPVKPEPVEGKVPAKKREKTPSNALRVYTFEEIAKFKKKELLADVELLDGTSNVQLRERDAISVG